MQSIRKMEIEKINVQVEETQSRKDDLEAEEK